MFFKKKKYKLNMQQANQSLQRVFQNCQQTPNKIPFNKIVLRQKLNTTFYDSMILFTSLILILTVCIPLWIFKNNTVPFTQDGTITLEADYVHDNILHLSLSGKNILYDEAYQEMPDGTCEKPVSYDKQNSVICFPYHSDLEVNIYIPSKSEKTLHILISPIQ